jgi:integrase
MKELELASIINQFNELLLKCNTLMCNNDTMDNAERKYGFYLLKIPSERYKSGFYYAVRYKDFESKKWIPTKKSTNTDNETLATAFAIENRERIIQEYKDHAKKIHTKNDGKDFYKMLEEYYTIDSKYLQDDYANNKRIIDKKQRNLNNGFINTYLIPYLQEKKINSIQEVNRSVYSGLKIHLQNVKNKKGKNLSTKTINNYLIAFNRILQYYERNELIAKLPYSRGTGIIKISKEEETNQPALLPIEKLKDIFSASIFFNKGEKKTDDYLFSYMLALIGLTTGMRESEIGRIKKDDIQYIKSEKVYILKVFNSKTSYYNKERSEKYRKIPLHLFVVKMLKLFLQTRENTEYIFGVPKVDDDTQKTDGYLHYRKPRKAIIEVYKHIKQKENFKETGKILESLIIEKQALEKEMREKNIVFYSLRHTFNTLCVLYRYNDTNTERSDDLIDYFMGHNSGSKMRANYSHINNVDNKTFVNNYGKFVFDVLNKYIFSNEEEDKKLEDYIDKEINVLWAENKHLLDKDGKISIEEVFDNILNPLLNKGRNKENEDDTFISV